MRGVVAAGHQATLAAAADVLRAGGNAYDAVVAAGFAAASAEPGLTSLAGGGFLLAHTADGDEILFDFFVDTPGRGLPPGVLEPDFTPVTLRFGAAEQVFNVGAGSVAVPGCLAGYLHVHRRLGRLDLAAVVAPGRRLAERGVALGADQVAVVRLLEPIFTLGPEGRGRYGRNGGVVAADELVVNRPLAAFLADVASGRVEGFATPGLAERIEAQMRRQSGLLTAADLRAYEVARRHVGAGPSSRKGTTHLSVCDADGNLAAMTTSNGSGSGVFLEDTGVMANNVMGEADLHPAGFHAEAPGRRVGSMMAPTVVSRPDADAVALGSGGFDPAAVDLVRAHRPVNEWRVTDLYFGGAHAASPSGDRAGDRRRGGTTAIVH